MPDRVEHTAIARYAEGQVPPDAGLTLRDQLICEAARADRELDDIITLQLVPEDGEAFSRRAVLLRATATSHPRPIIAKGAAGPYRPKVLVDFDGVIHRYSKGWADGTAYDDPMPGASSRLHELTEAGYEVVVFSTREATQIRDWLRDWHFPAYRITNVKEAAVAMIDDRAIRFENWDQAADDLVRLYPVDRRG